MLGIGLGGGYFLFANKTTPTPYTNTSRTYPTPTVNYQAPTPTTAAPKTTSQTSNTKLYKNSTYHFEFSYPSFFTEDKDIITGSLASFEAKDNHISVSVDAKSFKDFRYMDLSGTKYRYESTSKQWVTEKLPSKPATNITKTTDSLEAYETAIGDGACGGNLFFIPSPDQSYVITLSTTYCLHVDPSTQQFVDPEYKLSNKELLSTFKFTN
jgi:hypothetical protein